MRLLLVFFNSGNIIFFDTILAPASCHACSPQPPTIALVPPTPRRTADEQTSVGTNSLSLPNLCAQQSTPPPSSTTQPLRERKCRSRCTRNCRSSLNRRGEDESSSQTQNSHHLQPSRHHHQHQSRSVPVCEAPGACVSRLPHLSSPVLDYHVRNLAEIRNGGSGGHVRKSLLPRLRFLPFCSAVTPILIFLSGPSGSSMFIPVFEPLPPPPPPPPTGLIGGACTVVQSSACSAHSANSAHIQRFSSCA